MASPLLTGYQVLTPAYGRGYRSAPEARQAFFDGRDFVLHHPAGQTYCSVRDFAPGSHAQIRYGSGYGKLTIVEVK